MCVDLQRVLAVWFAAGRAICLVLIDLFGFIAWFPVVWVVSVCLAFPDGWLWFNVCGLDFLV